MNKTMRIGVSIVLTMVILICSCTVTVQASEINQDSNQEILLTEEKSASRSIPNAVSVIVKKVDSNSVRVFFRI